MKWSAVTCGMDEVLNKNNIEGKDERNRLN